MFVWLWARNHGLGPTKMPTTFCLQIAGVASFAHGNIDSFRHRQLPSFVMVFYMLCCSSIPFPHACGGGDTKIRFSRVLFHFQIFPPNSESNFA